MHWAQAACWLWLGAAALWAVRTDRVSAKTVRLAALALLAGSMGMTIALTVLDHKDLLRTLLPLHLCSLAAFLSLYLLATENAACYHFCWYLGLPGAALALVFPAVEPSSWPKLMQTSFMLTHALVVFAPLLLMAQGCRPAPGAAGGVLIVGNVFMAAVYAANRLLGANYMFLMWAPAGTPLAAMALLGRTGYFACLELGAVLVILGMRRLGKVGMHRSRA